jgi:ABC-2 type transport system permease protein
MSPVAGLAWAGWAVIVKTVTIYFRYPLNILNSLLIPLYQFLIPGLLLGATFAVGGRAVGLQSTAGTGDIAGFLFLGAFAMSFSYGIFWAVSRTLSAELTNGTLEASWVTPTPPELFPLASATASLLLAPVVGTSLLLIGSVVFGAHYLLTIAAGLPFLAIMAVGLIGMGYVVAAIVLSLKQAAFLVDMMGYLAAIGSGAMFPLTILPGGVKLVTLVLPTTLTLDLLRSRALGTATLLPLTWEYAVMAATAVAWAAFGRWVFRATERRLRISGRLGSY